MRAILQRVGPASVWVENEVVGHIAFGLLVYVGIGKEDSDKTAAELARKIVRLRIFEDEHGKMNQSVEHVGGGLLVVSQFTLYADTTRGTRPGFDKAMPPEQAEPLYVRFCELLRQSVRVETGRFRKTMRVVSENLGPVTVLLETS